jgi:uncharacterized protein (DUF1778 family)
VADCHYDMANKGSRTKINTASKKSSAAPSRLNVRLAPEVKTRIERAAALTGRDLTEFAVATLNEKAEEVIERHEHVLLNTDEYRFFLNTLSGSPQKPSRRAAAAAKLYKLGKRKGVRHHLAD